MVGVLPNEGLKLTCAECMRVIAAGLHRVLDFVTVAGFALAPSVPGLAGLAAALAYVLAAVHLALTLLTHFPGSAARPVPFLLHGAIEAVVGIALLVLPRLVGWSGTTGGARPA